MECVDTGWISSEGPFIKEFESKFSERMGRRFGVAVCNGTAALDIAVEAFNLQPGDEVIMPAFTIISCIGQIVRSGAKPVFAFSRSNRLPARQVARISAIKKKHLRFAKKTERVIILIISLKRCTNIVM